MQPQSPGWLETMLGPGITLKELNVIGWSLFFFFLLPSIYLGARMQSHNGKPVQYADFVNFYAMGRILTEYPAADLYDINLQSRICNEIAPPRSGSYGPIPYPPFVGIPFKFLARFSYTTAYLIWLSISLALYLSALTMVGIRFFPHDPLRLSLIFCVALCFFPFVIETLVNGQLSTIGFFVMALAFLLDDSGRPFLSGLALSLCAYKPTLLVLVIPMLFVTKRFKALRGFVTGGVALALLTTIFLGTDVWHGYLGMIFHFGQTSIGVRTGSNLNVNQYVDFVNLSSIMAFGRSWWAVAALFGFGLWAIYSLVRAWWHSVAARKPALRLAWAAALTWTLLLNAYVPIYDTTLAVLSVVITAGVLQGAGLEKSERVLNFLWPVIFVASWRTIDIAKTWHIQILTILLAVLGVFQIRMLSAVSSPVGGKTAEMAGVATS